MGWSSGSVDCGEVVQAAPVVAVLWVGPVVKVYCVEVVQAAPVVVVWVVPVVKVDCGEVVQAAPVVVVWVVPMVVWTVVKLSRSQ